MCWPVGNITSTGVLPYFTPLIETLSLYWFERTTKLTQATSFADRWLLLLALGETVWWLNTQQTARCVLVWAKVSRFRCNYCSVTRLSSEKPEGFHCVAGREYSMTDARCSLQLFRIQSRCLRGYAGCFTQLLKCGVTVWSEHCASVMSLLQRLVKLTVCSCVWKWSRFLVARLLLLACLDWGLRLKLLLPLSLLESPRVPPNLAVSVQSRTSQACSLYGFQAPWSVLSSENIKVGFINHTSVILLWVRFRFC